MNQAGFTTINEHNGTELCDLTDVYLDPIIFSEDEYINEIQVFVGNSKIRAIRIRTNMVDYGLFGNEYSNNQYVYVVEGYGLKRISYRGNSWSIFSLQFDFKEC